MVAPLGERLIDRRDRAILLLGFAGALRRSELSALDVEDLVETADGLKVSVGRSKTDQEGEGHAVGITYGSNPPTCPVRAWLAAVELAGGPAIRRLPHDRVTPHSIAGDGIARMLKRRAGAAGYAPELSRGHSLRSGFATTAARAGYSDQDKAEIKRLLVELDIYFVNANGAVRRRETTSPKWASQEPRRL